MKRTIARNKRFETIKAGLADDRGRTIVLVAHCLLNQNARYQGGASGAGCQRDAMKKIVNLDDGIIQLPCPEIKAWGGAEKPWIFLPTGKPKIRALLYRLFFPAFMGWTKLSFSLQARTVTREIREYLRGGWTIRKIIGIDGSPSCGIAQTLDMKRCMGFHGSLDPDAIIRDEYNRDLYRKGSKAGAGLFIRAMRKNFRKLGIDVEEEGWSLPDELSVRIDTSTVSL